MTWTGAAEGSAPGGERGRDATLHLAAWCRGDEAARGPLFELVYAELRDQARVYLAGERGSHTLQPTALVHEAWVRLIRADEVRLESRGHFLALAARAMRQVLVDHARSRARAKRGSGSKPVALEDTDGVGAADDVAEDAEGVLDLAEGLTALREVSARMADVVELRFFGGLSQDETADALGVSRNTVDRDWRAARAWLAARLDREGGP